MTIDDDENRRDSDSNIPSQTESDTDSDIEGKEEKEGLKLEENKPELKPDFAEPKEVGLHPDTPHPEGLEQEQHPSSKLPDTESIEDGHAHIETPHLEEEIDQKAIAAKSEQAQNQHQNSEKQDHARLSDNVKNADSLPPKHAKAEISSQAQLAKVEKLKKELGALKKSEERLFSALIDHHLDNFSQIEVTDQLKNRGDLIQLQKELTEAYLALVSLPNAEKQWKNSHTQLHNAATAIKHNKYIPEFISAIEDQNNQDISKMDAKNASSENKEAVKADQNDNPASPKPPAGNYGLDEIDEDPAADQPNKDNPASPKPPAGNYGLDEIDEDPAADQPNKDNPASPKPPAGNYGLDEIDEDPAADQPNKDNPASPKPPAGNYGPDEIDEDEEVNKKPQQKPVAPQVQNESDILAQAKVEKAALAKAKAEEAALEKAKNDEKIRVYREQLKNLPVGKIDPILNAPPGNEAELQINDDQFKAFIDLTEEQLTEKLKRCETDYANGKESGMQESHINMVAALYKEFHKRKSNAEESRKIVENLISPLMSDQENRKFRYTELQKFYKAAQSDKNPPASHHDAITSEFIRAINDSRIILKELAPYEEKIMLKTSELEKETEALKLMEQVIDGHKEDAIQEQKNNLQNVKIDEAPNLVKEEIDFINLVSKLEDAKLELEKQDLADEQQLVKGIENSASNLEKELELLHDEQESEQEKGQIEEMIQLLKQEIDEIDTERVDMHLKASPELKKLKDDLERHEFEISKKEAAIDKQKQEFDLALKDDLKRNKKLKDALAKQLDQDEIKVIEELLKKEADENKYQQEELGLIKKIEHELESHTPANQDEQIPIDIIPELESDESELYHAKQHIDKIHREENDLQYKLNEIRRQRKELEIENISEDLQKLREEQEKALKQKTELSQELKQEETKLDQANLQELGIIRAKGTHVQKLKETFEQKAKKEDVKAPEHNPIPDRDSRGASQVEKIKQQLTQFQSRNSGASRDKPNDSKNNSLDARRDSIKQLKKMKKVTDVRKNPPAQSR